MATRTSAPLGKTALDPAAEIQWDIVRTRAQMSRTVNEIEERLAPSRIKEQVLEQLHDAKERVKEEVLEDLDEAKEKVKETIEEARMAVREATVGRVETMVSHAKDTMNEASTSLVDTIKANPIPAAMVAVGIGWLLVSGRNNGGGRRMRARSRENPRIAVRDEYGEYGYGSPYLAGAIERGDAIDFDFEEEGTAEKLKTRAVRGARRAVEGAQGMAHDAKERIDELAHDADAKVRRAGDSVQRVAHDAGENVQRMAHDAGEVVTRTARNVRDGGRRVARRTGMQVRRAERGAMDMYETNPLAAGILAVAVGAAVGLALPHTRREDELLGNVRDRLLDQAQNVARTYAKQAIEKAEDAAGSATSNLGSAFDDKFEDKFEEKKEQARPNGQART